MTIPTPENTFSAATLEHIGRRRAHFQEQCPRHPGEPMTFWKELLVGTEGNMHLTASALYEDCCLAIVNLDTEDEPRYSEYEG
ncbi:hypothetical protein [Streptomyces sp. NPDC059278]|uniref:hypothetical protein n=1 Tax=Streptomyces sp. NPDC059278 TaxID=3346801 RepID=UPI0036C0B7BA